MVETIEVVRPFLLVLLDQVPRHGQQTSHARRLHGLHPLPSVVLHLHGSRLLGRHPPHVCRSVRRRRPRAENNTWLLLVRQVLGPPRLSLLNHLRPDRHQN